MSLVSRAAILAITAVVELALNARDGPVSSGTVAARLGLSRRALEPIFRRMAHHKIVESQRGTKGGYAVKRVGITVDEIVRAIGEDDAAKVYVNSELVLKVVLPALALSEDIFSSALGRITVEQLAASADNRLGTPA